MQTSIPSALSCLSSPPEGVCACLCVRVVVHVCGLPSIQSTFCPARVDLCLAAEQICQSRLVYIPGRERLHTWPQPSVKAQLPPGRTSGTKHQLTCPVGICWPQAPSRLSACSLHSLSALFRFSLLSFLALVLKDLFHTQRAQTVAQFSITCTELWPPIKEGIGIRVHVLMLLHTIVMVNEPSGSQVFLIHEEHLIRVNGNML